MKAVGYVRVSTETQIREGQGIKVQKEQIEKYCKAHELELIGIYEDRGISGAKADEKKPDHRPGRFTKYVSRYPGSGCQACGCP